MGKILSKLKEVKFRLHEKEMEIAKRHAESYDMSINAIAKFSVLNLSLPKNPEEALATKELNIQVGAIGNNLNQIARKLNTNKSFTHEEKTEIIKALNEVRNETRKLAGKEPVEEIQISKRVSYSSNFI